MPLEVAGFLRPFHPVAAQARLCTAARVPQGSQEPGCDAKRQKPSMGTSWEAVARLAHQPPVIGLNRMPLPRVWAALLPPTKYASRGEFLAGKGQPCSGVSPCGSGRGALLLQRGIPLLPGPVGRGHPACRALCSIQRVPQVTPPRVSNPPLCLKVGLGHVYLQQGKERAEENLRFLLGSACWPLLWTGCMSLLWSSNGGTSWLGALV